MNITKSAVIFFLSNERIFLVEMICVLKCFIVSRDD